MDRETAPLSEAGRIVDNIVHGFLKRQIEEAEEEAENPHLTWKEERGL
jgi:hypothetical protein